MVHGGFVVTGGLGGLGLRAAALLVASGVWGVVLASRDGLVVREGTGVESQLLRSLSSISRHVGGNDLSVQLYRGRQRKPSSTFGSWGRAARSRAYEQSAAAAKPVEASAARPAARPGSAAPDAAAGRGGRGADPAPLEPGQVAPAQREFAKPTPAAMLREQVRARPPPCNPLGSSGLRAALPRQPPTTRAQVV